jgi:hypothetical protein
VLVIESTLSKGNPFSIAARAQSVRFDERVRNTACHSIIRDGNRAAEIIARIRLFFSAACA